MSKKPDEQITGALQLTQQMKKLADEGSWDELASLEKKQSALLKACFESRPSFANRQQAETTVRQILQLNQEILQLGQEAQMAVREELQSINKGRNAAKAYLECPE